ncbi:MAG: efflux transporter outer membrane subunit [Desulfocapsaceae bacterium]|nr:efflux transporter outer membrane subunit [Desulfocapsaceae bacterium]
MRYRLWAAALLMLSACSMAPVYKQPEVQTPAAYRESAGWVKAMPADGLERGAWWKIFHDPRLDKLEGMVEASNQNLKAALARYDQASAEVRAARAMFFPDLTVDASATRNQLSGTIANTSPRLLYNTVSAGADLSYEIDIWGRVRNSVAAGTALAQASADDLAVLALSLHAEMADAYFMLGASDVAQDILEKTVETNRTYLEIVRQRYDGGVAAESDVLQADLQVQNSLTQATEMRLQRAGLEHAIALLAGLAPGDFKMAPVSLPEVPPKAETGIPSVLLQRRPDIAAAERRVAAANAQVGVAEAAWFPDFNLAAMLGFSSSSVPQLFTEPSRVWSLGPSVAAPVFDGGKIRAMTDEAKAVYEQTVAGYRQTVLNAYGEVEDNLAALHRLEQEDRSQTAAVSAARRQLAQAFNRYQGGLATYLDVAVAQNGELQARLAAVSITARRLTASVHLVKAVGGGWHAEDGAVAENPAPSP